MKYFYVFLIFLILFQLCNADDFVTILIRGYTNSDCRGKEYRQYQRYGCKYVRYSEIGYCNPINNQKWEWNANGIKSTRFSDSSCSKPEQIMEYKQGCRSS